MPTFLLTVSYQKSHNSLSTWFIENQLNTIEYVGAPDYLDTVNFVKYS